MKTLLDTNILVHAYNKSSPQQQQASKIVRDALQSHLVAYITPQILFEFFSVVTNPRRVGNPLTTPDAVRICEDFWVCHDIEVLEPLSSTTSLVFSLVKKHGISGAHIFDCIIAATAKDHEIDQIYTENTKDFEIYDFLKVTNPFAT